MSDATRKCVIGITGHQALTSYTQELVTESMRKYLQQQHNPIGVTSLAAGADQIFAQLVLDCGGLIQAVMPAKRYEQSFDTEEPLAKCRHFLKQAHEIVFMPFDDPSEEAYWAAGKEIVRRADILIAVWDGRPAAGLGGTGDVVRYAHSQGKQVEIIWPEGARRA